MAVPILTYFNFFGRAEIVRLIFAQAGVTYEDRRLTSDEWTKMKSDCPTGQIPMLEVDGVKICQSHAIARYVATEHGLYDGSNLEKARIDMVCDTFEDYMEPYVKAFFEPNSQLKEKYLKEAVEKSKTFLTILEKWLEENGTGYYVGSKISMADITAMHIISFSKMLPHAGPLVTKHVNMMTSQPRIKAWLEERPKTAH